MEYPPQDDSWFSSQQTSVDVSQHAGSQQPPMSEAVRNSSASSTAYAFISQSGDETAATSKTKLKTVRSHVMKNYLKQRRKQGHSTKEKGTGTIASGSGQRKEKEYRRTSRSVSRDIESLTSSAISSEPRGRSESATSELQYVHMDDSLSRTASHAFQLAETQTDRSRRFALEFDAKASDDVSISAQTYVDCVVKDIKNGLAQSSFETLQAKGEAISLVQNTIASCGSQVPQSVILAMTSLAIGCGKDRAWEEARGHIEALHSVLDMRGGMQSLDFELQRKVCWTTFVVASILQFPSRIPSVIFTDFRPCSLAFQDEAQIRAWRTIKRFPKKASFIFDLLHHLHQLALASSAEWYDQIDQRYLSNIYFSAMDSAIILPQEEPWNDVLPRGAPGREMATMFRIWAASLPLFIMATARHAQALKGVETPRCRHDPIFIRVRTILESTGGQHAWPRGKTLEPLLVTFVYCAEGCEYVDAMRPWFVDMLRRAAELLKLNSLEDFRKTLEFFPSTDIFRATADNLWNEMYHGSVVSTPLVQFPGLTQDATL